MIQSRAHGANGRRNHELRLILLQHIHALRVRPASVVYNIHAVLHAHLDGVSSVRLLNARGGFLVREVACFGGAVRHHFLAGHVRLDGVDTDVGDVVGDDFAHLGRSVREGGYGRYELPVAAGDLLAVGEVAGPGDVVYV